MKKHGYITEFNSRNAPRSVRNDSPRCAEGRRERKNMKNIIEINLDNLTRGQLLALERILYTAGTVEDVKKVDLYLAKYLEKALLHNEQ